MSQVLFSLFSILLTLSSCQTPPSFDLARADLDTRRYVAQFEPFQNRLDVVSFTPAGRVEAPDAAIAIEFSQPMVSVPATGLPLAKAPFRITPAIQGHAAWETPRVLVFHPAESLPPSTRYELNLSDRLTSLAGVSLAAKKVFTFATPANFAAVRKIRQADGATRVEVRRDPLAAQDVVANGEGAPGLSLALAAPSTLKPGDSFSVGVEVFNSGNGSLNVAVTCRETGLEPTTSASQTVLVPAHASVKLAKDFSVTADSLAGDGLVFAPANGFRAAAEVSCEVSQGEVRVKDAVTMGVSADLKARTARQAGLSFEPVTLEFSKEKSWLDSGGDLEISLAISLVPILRETALTAYQAFDGMAASALGAYFCLTPYGPGSQNCGASSKENAAKLNAVFKSLEKAQDGDGGFSDAVGTSDAALNFVIHETLVAAQNQGFDVLRLKAKHDAFLNRADSELTKPVWRERALAASALTKALKDGPWSARATDLVTKILARSNDETWDLWSEFQVQKALVTAVAKAPVMRKPFALQMILNDGAVANFELGLGREFESMAIPLDKIPDAVKIRLTAEGSGFYYSARMTGTQSVDEGGLEENGLALMRRLYDGQGRPVTDSDLRPGEIYEARYALHLKEAASRIRIAERPPGGLSLIATSFSGNFKTALDREKAAFELQNVAAGYHRFSCFFRAEFPGSYRWLPAKALNPDVLGQFAASQPGAIRISQTP